MTAPIPDPTDTPTSPSEDPTDVPTDVRTGGGLSGAPGPQAVPDHPVADPDGPADDLGPSTVRAVAPAAAAVAVLASLVWHATTIVDAVADSDAAAAQALLTYARTAATLFAATLVTIMVMQWLAGLAPTDADTADLDTADADPAGMAPLRDRPAQQP